MRERQLRLWQVAPDEGGFSLVEILLVLVVLAILGVVLYAYIGSTTKTLERFQEERPLSQARLTADRATLTAIRSAIQVYHARHGHWPPSKEAVAELLNPPPHLQCAGNDYEYDAGAGQIRLLIDDPSRC